MSFRSMNPSLLGTSRCTARFTEAVRREAIEGLSRPSLPSIIGWENVSLSSEDNISLFLVYFASISHGDSSDALS
jgi:hypothetical protein